MWHKNTIKYIFSRKASNPTNSEGKWPIFVNKKRHV
jgi:hypothetical protein